MRFPFVVTSTLLLICAPACVDHDSAIAVLPGTPGSGVASALSITKQPSATNKAGTSMSSVCVAVVDSSGRTLPNANATITVALAQVAPGVAPLTVGAGAPELEGSPSAETAEGVAEFADLSIKTAGPNYMLEFKAEGLEAAFSDLFAIEAGPPVAMKAASAPESVIEAGTIAPAVDVVLVDEFGNLANSAPTMVAAAIGQNPGDGTLSGTTQVESADGTARFADLSIDLRGRGYTLNFSAADLPPIESDGFKVFRPSWVLTESKISQAEGGFTGSLQFGADFGGAVAPLGDLNGDGVVDVAVGAPGEGLFGAAGAVFVFLLRGDGTVLQHVEITGEDVLTFGGPTAEQNFGASMANLGDLDGDGLDELAVGGYGNGDNVGGTVWILSFNPDGTMRQVVDISSPGGGFSGAVDPFDRFGWSVARVDDINGDGVPELAVGADADGAGAVWVCYLTNAGTVNGQYKIAAGSGGFTGAIEQGDRFGSSVASLGDLDGNGVVDLAIGARADDDGGGFETGAVWLLMLEPDGTVGSQRKLSRTEGELANVIEDGSSFGAALGQLSDLDGDGIRELCVGAPLDQGNEYFAGAIFTLFLSPDGTVRTFRKITNNTGGFERTIDPFDRFGRSVANIGDLDRDGVEDILVGAPGDDDFSSPKGGPEGKTDYGAVWLLRVDGK